MHHEDQERSRRASNPSTQVLTDRVEAAENHVIDLLQLEVMDGEDSVILQGHSIQLFNAFNSFKLVSVDLEARRYARGFRDEGFQLLRTRNRHKERVREKLNVIQEKLRALGDPFQVPVFTYSASLNTSRDDVEGEPDPTDGSQVQNVDGLIEHRVNAEGHHSPESQEASNVSTASRTSTPDVNQSLPMRSQVSGSTDGSLNTALSQASRHRSSATGTGNPWLLRPLSSARPHPVRFETEPTVIVSARSPPVPLSIPAPISFYTPNSRGTGSSSAPVGMGVVAGRREEGLGYGGSSGWTPGGWGTVSPVINGRS